MNNNPNQPPGGPPPFFPPFFNLHPSMFHFMLQWQAFQHNAMLHQAAMRQLQLQQLPPQALLQQQNAARTGLVVPPDESAGIPAQPVEPSTEPAMSSTQSAEQLVEPSLLPTEQAVSETEPVEPVIQEAQQATVAENPIQEPPLPEPSKSETPMTEATNNELSTEKEPPKGRSKRRLAKANVKPVTAEEEDAPPEKTTRKEPEFDVLAIMKNVEFTLKEEEKKKEEARKKKEQAIFKAKEAFLAEKRKAKEAVRSKRQTSVDPFFVPPSFSYIILSDDELLEKKQNIKRNCIRFMKYGQNMPFHEQQNYIFETLRDRKIRIDIEREEQRRKLKKDTLSSSSQVNPSKHDEEKADKTRVFPQYVYENFEVGVLEDIAERIDASIPDYIVKASKVPKEHRDRLKIWYSRLHQIKQEMKSVLEQHAEIMKISNLLDETGDTEMDECDGFEKYVENVLIVMRGYTGINLTVMSEKEAEQLKWMAAELRAIPSPSTAMDYLRAVLDRMPVLSSPPPDYKHGQTEVSTSEVFGIMTQDYQFYRNAQLSLMEGRGSEGRQQPNAIIRTANNFKTPKSSELVKKLNEKQNPDSRKWNEGRSRELKPSGNSTCEKETGVSPPYDINSFKEDIRIVSDEELSGMVDSVRSALRFFDALYKNQKKPGTRIINTAQFSGQHQRLKTVLPYLRKEVARRTMMAKNKEELAEKKAAVRERFAARVKALFSNTASLSERQRTEFKKRLLRKAAQDKETAMFLWELFPKIEKELGLCPPTSADGSASGRSLRFAGLEMMPLNWQTNALRQIVKHQKNSHAKRVSELKEELKSPQCDTDMKSPKQSDLEMVECKFVKSQKGLLTKIREVSRNWEVQKKKNSMRRKKKTDDFKLLPSDVVFDISGSRVSVGTNHRRYPVTIDEILRRVGGIERISSSNLSALLRRPKTKSNGDLMRSQLQNIGVILPLNRRSPVRVTKIMCLKELEAGAMFNDMATLCRHYPVEEIADEVVTSFIERGGRLLYLGEDCDDALDMLKTVASVFSSVRPPISGHFPIASKDKELNFAMEKFSQATHGFGIQSFQFWIKKVVDIVGAMANHERLHNKQGARLTEVPKLEIALQMSKNYPSSAIVEYVEKRKKAEQKKNRRMKVAARRKVKK